jgi:hypothetical protein
MASRSSYPIADGTVPSPSISANGQFPPEGVSWPGGTGSLQVMGSFGGGTAKLQMLAEDRLTYLDVGQNVTFSSNGVGGFLAPPCTLVLTVTGATAPSLKAYISQIA